MNKEIKFEPENRYNPSDDTVEWSMLKQNKEIKRQIGIRLIRYKKGELKIQLLHHRLNDFDEPEGYNVNRYNIKEIDTLISVLQDAKKEYKKQVNSSNIIEDIFNKIWLNGKV